jgi:hypothetical protein
MTIFSSTAAGLLLGSCLGWLVTSIATHAAISRAQERMERKVRHWQGQAEMMRRALTHAGRYADSRDSPPIDARGG